MATTANSGNKTQHELYLASPPALAILSVPFLKPVLCRECRDNKMHPKAKQRFYLSEGSNHACNSFRVPSSLAGQIYSSSETWEYAQEPPSEPVAGGGGPEAYVSNAWTPPPPSNVACQRGN